MHKDAAFLKSVLVPGGSVPAEEICQVLAQDEPFAPLFANTALFAAAQAGDESQSGSLTASSPISVRWKMKFQRPA